MATYITKDDYFSFSGIDLEIELRKGNTDNPSKAVDIFLQRVEDFCLDYLHQNYRITPTSDEWDAVYFKKGALHQIDYIRLHGELSIDAANGMATLAPNAFTQFQLAGMTNIAPNRPTSYWGGRYGY
ncbi:MAG: hypothetical protein WCX48_12120 [Bacteroidales bacterium]|jgi:hypothetical protein